MIIIFIIYQKNIIFLEEMFIKKQITYNQKKILINNHHKTLSETPGRYIQSLPSQSYVWAWHPHNQAIKTRLLHRKSVKESLLSIRVYQKI